MSAKDRAEIAPHNRPPDYVHEVAGCQHPPAGILNQIQFPLTEHLTPKLVATFRKHQETKRPKS